MSYRFDLAVDLTQTLENGMPVYPGDPAPSFELTATNGVNGVNLTRLILGSHTETRVGAPIHFIPNGIGVDAIPVTSLAGEALVIDVSSKPIGSGITAADLDDKLGQENVADYFVLAYTGSSDCWGNPETNSNYTYLTQKGRNSLSERGSGPLALTF
ncbi:MAG TPA: cyclase family protein [Nitrososphaerales archaeon]|nr:cyclase family protein [Nitrososphaerales archaeon]